MSDENVDRGSLLSAEALARVRTLLNTADAVVMNAGSEDDSPEADEAFVAGMVRLRDAALAVRVVLSLPPGPPNPPRGPWQEGIHG